MNWVHIFKNFSIFFFSLVIIFSSLGILNGIRSVSHAADQADPVLPEGIEGAASVQTWLASELHFVSPVAYQSPFYDVDFSFTFVNRNTGKTLKIPAFWDGEQNFTVRFALPETGVWDFTIECSDAANPLAQKAGAVRCTEYDGKYEIYKRGFVKTSGRYFTYADGTPFFYLGDTHWHMALEDIDTAIAMEDGSVSTRFDYTLSRREEQGFTVIQSEPLGVYDGSNDYFKDIFEEKFSQEQLERFQQYDKYFAAIAAHGFVHANAQFSYPTSLGDAMNVISDEDLARLCRYWAARYSAYPVLWTLSQECDNDYYYGESQTRFTAENNPWKKVAEYLHENDPYQHPLSAHQENTANTLASNSAFKDIEAHTWWAAQVNYSWQSGTQFNIYQDYWEHGSGKPGIEYEGMYDHFWTGTWGARLQGWLAFLNGMYGYGYGSAKIWSANETPGIWAGAIQQKIDDGLEQLTYQDMDISWQESLNLPAAAQLGYMKQFFSQYEWWNLTPCFSSNEIFESYMGGKTNDEFRYSAAHIGTDLYMAYFYNIGMDSGAFKGLQKGTYLCKWFDPCTGEYRDEHERRIDSKGLMEIGDKPNNGDWVFIAEYLPGSSGASSGGGFTAWIVAWAALLVAAAASVLLILRSKKRRKQRGGI